MNLSLNDAAALLVQIEPEDKTELLDLQNLLLSIVDDDTYPDATRRKVESAAEIIGTLVDEKAADPDMAITEVGQCIEEAMNILEESVKEEKRPDINQDDLMDDPSEKTTIIVETRKDDDISSSYQIKDTDRELVEAFIIESVDLITNAEDALLTLEADPEDMDAVGTVFRAFHTVKGTSAFLEIKHVADLAHHAETLLSRIRDREIRFEGNYPDLALQSIDMIKALIQAVGKTLAGEVFYLPAGYNELLEILADPDRMEAEVTVEYTEEQLMPSIEPGIRDELEATEVEIVQPSGEIEKEIEQPKTEIPEARPPIRPMEEPKPNSLRESEQEAPIRRLTEGAGQTMETSVRVPVERLDRFIDLVGELVVAHSMVAQDSSLSDGDMHDLSKKVGHTSKIVRELQHMSMTMRMVPLKPTFRKMARLVRDLSRKAGKNVTFVSEGEDTEIDRNMVDIINDPLVHLVRNAVDHGIESSKDRGELGKSAAGTVKLSAYHSAGKVFVEIRDDGKGLNYEAILSKALDRGLIDENAVLNEREVYNLIFMPGFSTANVVSEVSGRGVGMDVVKKNIEALRGQVDIETWPGEGSLFRMNFPLTLAIIDGMVVRVGQERYVIPTLSIVRSIQPESKDLTMVLNRGEMLSISGKLIPFFRLDSLFEVRGAQKDPTQAIVVVVEDDGKQAGILIDELIGSQQIVIKNLGETMQDIPGVSGSAILPNGRVGLILDIGGLVKLANTVYDSEQR